VKPGVTQAEWFSIMSDADQRLAWIEDGIAFGKEFLSKMDATKETKATKATNEADAADPDAAATTPPRLQMQIMFIPQKQIRFALMNNFSLF